MSRQPTEWKKLFASFITDKCLLRRIHKEHLQAKHGGHTCNLSTQEIDAGG
jgi:hypothetical protein